MVITTSTPGRPCSGWMSVGMPRPLSSTLHAAVGLQGHVDSVAEAGQGLVDGVVHDLVDQVVQAARAGAPDVHARALADPLEALQDLDLAGVVGVAVLFVHSSRFRVEGEADALMVGPGDDLPNPLQHPAARGSQVVCQRGVLHVDPESRSLNPKRTRSRRARCSPDDLAPAREEGVVRHSLAQARRRRISCRIGAIGPRDPGPLARLPRPPPCISLAGSSGRRSGMTRQRRSGLALSTTGVKIPGVVGSRNASLQFLGLHGPEEVEEVVPVEADLELLAGIRRGKRLVAPVPRRASASLRRRLPSARVSLTIRVADSLKTKTRRSAAMSSSRLTRTFLLQSVRDGLFVGRERAVDQAGVKPARPQVEQAVALARGHGDRFLGLAQEPLEDGEALGGNEGIAPRRIVAHGGRPAPDGGRSWPRSAARRSPRARRPRFARPA